MTECERLIADGAFTPEFFKPEVRCDFLVSTERKKIWAIELDLLLRFDEVCKRHGLKYFLAEGSLLGAIRHKGFIPWDDDTDVVMFREDYEQLLTLADEFPEPYFLQIPGKDVGYYFSFAKLRNSNTTAVGIPFRFEKFNQGIGIDIFVLDVVDIGKDEIGYLRIADLIHENSTYMRRSNINPTEEDIRRISSCGDVDPRANLDEINQIATLHKGICTDHVGIMNCTIYPFVRHVWRKEAFDGSAFFPVEGFRFPVPSGFDHILSTTYGDYLTFPPKEQRGQWHKTTEINPDVPYRKYLQFNG